MKNSRFLNLSIKIFIFAMMGFSLETKDAKTLTLHILNQSAVDIEVNLQSSFINQEHKTRQDKDDFIIQAGGIGEFKHTVDTIFKHTVEKNIEKMELFQARQVGTQSWTNNTEIIGTTGKGHWILNLNSDGQITFTQVTSFPTSSTTITASA